MYVTFGSIEIPKVYHIDTRYLLVGERARTAGGYLRQDVIATKRVWTINTRAMSPYSADALISALMAANFSSGDFWIADFGYTGEGENQVKNTVRAFIKAESLEDSIAPFGEDGTWYQNGRRLTIEVEEV